jgi:hypothetical protein
MPSKRAYEVVKGGTSARDPVPSVEARIAIGRKFAEKGLERAQLDISGALSSKGAIAGSILALWAGRAGKSLFGSFLLVTSIGLERIRLQHG